MDTDYLESGASKSARYPFEIKKRHFATGRTDKRMRIFYVGQLDRGGTCLDRMRCIESMGHEVIPFDLSGLTHMPRIAKAMACRFNSGPLVSGINRALCRSAHGMQKISLFWIDKGRWIWPETIDRIKRLTGAAIIHYTPDAAFFLHKSRHFARSIHKYDLLFTTKPFEVDLYRRNGARRIHLTDQAFEKTRFYPRHAAPDLASDVTFVGHYERHYAGRLRTLAGLKKAVIKVWGPGWGRRSRVRQWCRPYVQGEGVWGEEYPKAISSAKICLGLLSKLVPDTSTTRTFEIPACGGFMLAERTEEHLGLFEEGREAEFFASDEEMLDKVRYYLTHPGQRDKIAAAGRERCLKSGYSNHDRIKDMLRKATNL